MKRMLKIGAAILLALGLLVSPALAGVGNCRKPPAAVAQN